MISVRQLTTSLSNIRIDFAGHYKARNSNLIYFCDGGGTPSSMGKLGAQKIAIIAPTCFYYQAPLFRVLAADDRIDLTVYFCTDEGSTGKD